MRYIETVIISEWNGKQTNVLISLRVDRNITSCFKSVKKTVVLTNLSDSNTRLQTQ